MTLSKSLIIKLLGRFPRPLLLCVPLAVSAYAGLTNGQKTVGWIEFTKKNYTAAGAYFTQAGDQRGLGMVALAQKDLEGAQRAFTIVGDERGLGLVANHRHQYVEALAHFTRAGDDSGRGLALLGLRRLEDATAAFAKANDWSGLGLVLLSRKDIPNARAAFAKVEDHRGLGLCALEDEDFETAAREFTQVEDQEGLCLLALKEGRLDEAMSLALAQKDGSLQGMILLAKGEREAAEVAFTAANDVYFAGRRYAEARAAFEVAHNPVKVIQSYRNDFTLGDAAKNEQAIAYGLKAAADGRMPVECLCEVADAQYHAGRPEEALTTLTQAAAYPGGSSEVALRRGRILFYQRQFEAAREAFASVKPGEVSAIAYRAATESLETLDRYRDLNLASSPSF